MGNGPCTFREADLAKALKAAKKAGVRVRIEIESGNKLAVTMLPIAQGVSKEEPNPWDEDDEETRIAKIR
jgi:hypothetical protein